MTEQETYDSETPYESADTSPTTGRQGRLFFKLCDMRVATVGTNAVNIVVISIGLIVHMIKYFGIMPLQAALPAFILSGIGIFGAVNFELWAVAMAALGFAIGLLVDIWWLNIFGIIMGLLVLYPTATLAWEIHTGVMDWDTYQDREEFIDFDMVEKAGIKKEYLTNFHEKFPAVNATFGSSTK